MQKDDEIISERHVQAIWYDGALRPAGLRAADGAPVRVVVSPKTLGRNAFELSARDKSFREDIAIDGAAETVAAKVRELIAAINAKVPERI